MKRALEYPLKIFKNDFVLKMVIHSVWITFLLFSVAYEVNYYDPELFEKHKTIYTLLKTIFNTFISICVLGYFISKYKFCVITIASFYGIVLLRLTYLIYDIFKIEDFTIAALIIERSLWCIVIYKIIINKIVSPN